jgi:hypothetical protein
MKGLFVGSLSVLLFSTVATSVVHAEQAAYNPAVAGRNSAHVTYVSPAQLVLLAYRGDLKSVGIPSYSELRDAFYRNQITAKDLVQGAVNSKLLPPQFLANKKFIKDVDGQLFNFSYNF